MQITSLALRQLGFVSSGGVHRGEVEGFSSIEYMDLEILVGRMQLKKWEEDMGKVIPCRRLTLMLNPTRGW